MKKIIFVILWLIILITFSNIYLSLAYPIKYSDSIQNYAKVYDIEEELIYAIIRCESMFQPTKISPKGACGLMQIMPSTFEYMATEGQSKEDIFQADLNINIGTRYLRYLKNKFKDTSLIICSYNAGEGNVNKWLNDTDYSPDGKTLYKIPFSETKKYLDKVIKTQKIYQKLLKKQK